MPNSSAAAIRLAPSLPATEQLLLEGGGSRIALNPATGLNKYGCGPVPDPSLLAFGSSTASTISEPAFAAAGRLRKQLLRDLANSSFEEVYRREIGRFRAELLALCGLADWPGLKVVIAESGTDLHGLVAQWVCLADSTPTCIIMMAADETGCGVPSALASQSHRPLLSVSLRQPDGNPRPQAEVDDEVEALVKQAVQHGQRVLLISLDVSKSGLMAPSFDCVERLIGPFADRLDVLVDACQFRIASASLRAYLQRGCMVAMTGSKFLGGPCFSAALMVPETVASHITRSALASASAASFIQAKDSAHLGLLLRWEAALEEFRAFNALPQQVVVDFLQTFGIAFQQRLADDAFFEALPVLPLERLSNEPQKTWDRFATIFPFRVLRSASRTPLSREALSRVHHALLLPNDQGIAMPPCQLGQPVACGFHDGTPVSALRLCLSARLIAEGTAQATAVIDRSMLALDKTRWLAQKIYAEE